MSGWRKNDHGQGEFVISPEIIAEMTRHAERIKEAAVATSPVGTAAGDDTPGAYRDAWQVESGIRHGTGHPRGYAQVFNDSEYAASVEFGNGRTDPPHRQRKTIDAHHVLARAIETAREL